MYLPGSAEGLRWNTLSEIEKPGSGTEPIHQEHVMCSRFRGSCPSDVKSAVHPEPGFPISLSVFTAALCPPRETQKASGARHPPEAVQRKQREGRDIPNPPKNIHNIPNNKKSIPQNAFFILFFSYFKFNCYFMKRKVIPYV